MLGQRGTGKWDPSCDYTAIPTISESVGSPFGSLSEKIEILVGNKCKLWEEQIDAFQARIGNESDDDMMDNM